MMWMCVLGRGRRSLTAVGGSDGPVTLSCLDVPHPMRFKPGGSRGLGLGNFRIFPIIQKNTKFKGSADGSPTQYPTQHQTHPNPPIEANDTDLHR